MGYAASRAENAIWVQRAIEQPVTSRERIARRGLGAVWPSYVGYTLLHLVTFPWLALQGVRRARKRYYGGRVWRRLIAQAGPGAARGAIVLVANGLGEARVAAKLAEELREQRYSVELIGTTDDAFSLANVKMGHTPFNNPVSVGIFLARYRPAAVWAVGFLPNHHLKAICSLVGVPVTIVNVQMSERDAAEIVAKPSTWWRWRPVALYAVPAEAQRTRLRAIGVADEQIAMTGLVGIGLAGMPDDPEATRAYWRRELFLEGRGPVVLAGSTRPDDEKVVLEAFQLLQQTHPSAVLILAPRELTRPGGIEAVLVEMEVEFARRSSMREPASVILLDTQGELRDVYSVADVAFVGGTFDPLIGGHSPTEAMAWGVPLTAGPFTAEQPNLTVALTQNGRSSIADTSARLAQLWRDAVTGADAEIPQAEEPSTSLHRLIKAAFPSRL